MVLTTRDRARRAAERDALAAVGPKVGYVRAWSQQLLENLSGPGVNVRQEKEGEVLSW